MMLSTISIQAIAYSAVAVGMFQTAVLFISGDLAKDALRNIYEVLPQAWHRMLFALPTLLGPGNIIVSKAFANPIVAAPAVMFFQIWAAAFAYCYLSRAWLPPSDIVLLFTISGLVIWLAVRLSH